MGCPYKTSLDTVQRILTKCGVMKNKDLLLNHLVIRELETIFDDIFLHGYLKGVFVKAIKEKWNDDYCINQDGDDDIFVNKVFLRSRKGVNTSIEIIYKLIHIAVVEKDIPKNMIIPYIKKFVMELCTLDFEHFGMMLGQIDCFDRPQSDVNTTYEGSTDVIELGESEMRINVNTYPDLKQRILGSGLCPALVVLTTKPNGESVTVVKYLLEIAHDALCSIKE